MTDGRASRRRVLLAAVGIVGAVSGCAGSGSTTPSATADGTTRESERPTTGAAGGTPIRTSTAEPGSNTAAGSTTEAATDTTVTPVPAPDPVIPMSRVDGGNTGVVDTVGPAGKPDLDWTQTVGEVTAQPLVAGDTIVVVNRSGEVIVVDAKTGELVWWEQFEGAAKWAPALSGSTLVVPTYGEPMYALDVRDGTERWRWMGDMAAVEQPPVVVGDEVVVQDDDGVLRAMALADGTTRWATEMPGKYTFDAVGGPATDGDAVYVATDSQRIEAYGLAAGQRRWSVSLADRKLLQPPVVHEVVLFQAVDVSAADPDAPQTEVLALAAADGSEQWRTGLEPWELQTPVPVGETVFAAGAAGETDLYALKRGTGEVAWSTGDVSAVGQVMVAAGVAYVTEKVEYKSEGKYIRAYDVTARESHWRLEIGVEVTAPPVVADGTVYVVADSTLRAYS